MSYLKEIVILLPKIRSGRELTINYDKSGYWYVGWPNENWDFSVDLYANDKDIEGACLHLLALIDKESMDKGEESL